MNCARRPSMSSATRYRTWPRFIAVLALHPGTAPRAVRMASRRSFLDERTALASGVPSGARTMYVRPDSERGNAPPTYSLYVLRTAMRATGGLAIAGLATARVVGALAVFVVVGFFVAVLFVGINSPRPC